MEKEPKIEIKDRNDRQAPEEILGILRDAIESNSMVELTVSNPPSKEDRTAIVLPAKVEEGHLQVIFKNGVAISIELYRIKKIVPIK